MTNAREDATNREEKRGSGAAARTERAGSIRRSLDELDERPGLEPERRLLILAAGAAARGDDPLSEDFFSEAIARGAAPGDLSEIILQTFLFAGYPRAINALLALRAAAGPYEPFEEDTTDDAVQRFAARGRRLCRRIYGDHYASLRQNIRSLHPDLDRWMVEEGYGRVLGRPRLDVVTRELAALTALIVLDVARQVRAHLNGARNVGADDGEIEETIEQARLFAAPPAVDRARQIWFRVREHRS